ncbi:hypothetical protein F4806DRAFT_490462 [Annulohypoxylon nitens]|nr:hypothetical protein F4806DRAFT_490462 [Annulohypoxylon nitens]
MPTPARAQDGKRRRANSEPMLNGIPVRNIKTTSSSAQDSISVTEQYGNTVHDVDFETNLQKCRQFNRAIDQMVPALIDLSEAIRSLNENYQDNLNQVNSIAKRREKVEPAAAVKEPNGCLPTKSKHGLGFKILHGAVVIASLAFPILLLRLLEEYSTLPLDNNLGEYMPWLIPAVACVALLYCICCIGLCRWL